MVATTQFGFTALLLSSLHLVNARERWLERDNKAVFLHPRRFGQEQPAVIQKLSQACAGQVCGTLAGEAVTPLLAAQGECTQQDHADKIIDAAAQFDAATKANMIAIAVEYRQVEKNTPPDFTTNPPSLRNSVFCQKAPKNPELNGLVQAQDPANDPDLFFDPATKSTVKKGTQANTAPFGGEAAAPADNAKDGNAAGADASRTATPAESTAAAASSSCAATVTVTASGTAVATATAAVTVSAGTPAATDAPGDGGAIGDFGDCSVPQIEFGAGFDGRKETSFQPVDKASYDHSSAQNPRIITQFICDTLVNKCGADATALATCATAEAELEKGADKTGEQADLFNAVFGIKTNFADVDVVDNQGNVVQAGSGGGAADAGDNSADQDAGADATTTQAASNEPAATATAAAGNLQKFTGALGDVTPPAVTDVGNGKFQVDGNSAFNNLENALVRSCDVQHNKCANAANASGNKGELTVAACGDQQEDCIALARA